MVEDCEDATPQVSPSDFKSRGTPSSPSRSSIPGKASKYSKPPPNGGNPRNSRASASSHPAFRRVAGVSRGTARLPLEAADERPEITIGENGVAYKIGNAPFEFQYSYTETPKVKPLALREPPYLPFGPATMPRPWTGRAPLPPSKKKLPEFDSFRPPPPGKKGVKPVQSPGPFLAGAGPKYEAATREETLGEPLTQEEVKDLIKACIKTKRQLNIGRDGLTHNMLDNIHAHWKRRRVCKIKCKGVCTVDMDNVRQQLEERTGGKVIFSRGGVVFLFRGRNYNYRTRPRFPLMLWKPIPPVYPRLVQRAPEGLTLEEATEMRKIGRKLTPICKLGKNGVYCNLVKDVKEAFEECELVRINCQGLNKSDTRKIGAKLKDLVPCILLSFELEHILVWRGRDWRSSLLPSGSEQPGSEEPKNSAALVGPTDCSEEDALLLSDLIGESAEEMGAISDLEASSEEDDPPEEPPLRGSSRNPEDHRFMEGDDPSTSACLAGVRSLLSLAIESGGAVVLDDESLDADSVRERAARLARTAPAGPVFRHRAKKAHPQKAPKEGNRRSEEEERPFLEMGKTLKEKKATPSRRREKINDGFLEMGKSLKEKKIPPSRRREVNDGFLEMVPHGSLGVDELAKLLT
ncbi:unnamed protein product [Spirodela intermedia]|uniref:CRM domain-containing protein n=1 Tax=Spirodela intermedia TaxID=51605 RepID=A0A7I8LJ83_SPIIN|nr:unnamed protein product [Spirodela intermedia]